MLTRFFIQVPAASVGFWAIVNDTRNVHRVILRIITVTRATCRTSGAAIGCSLHDDRHPENLDVAVRATQHLRLHVALILMQFSIVLVIGLSAFFVHILWPVKWAQ